jgi:benzylsuccinate CoA-transferase BbsF subunit
VAFTDYFAMHLVAISLMAALDYRRRTGKGQFIDFSQLEAFLPAFGPILLDYTVNGREQTRQGNRHPTAAPHGAFPCPGQDRWCVITVFTDEQWQSFCKVIGEPEWTREPKFSTASGRKQNEEELEKRVAEWTAVHPAEQVMTLMQEAGVPAGVVKNPEDLYLDPQFEHRKHFWHLQHPEIGEYDHSNHSFRLSKSPAPHPKSAPCLGEHNDYVYKELLGMTEEEYVNLLLEGVFE